MSRRGYYSIVTTFIFIVLLVAVVLVGISLQGKVFQSQRSTDDLALGFTIAREGLTSYLACHDDSLKQSILDTPMGQPGSCPLPALVSGITVVQYGVLPCAAQTWTFGMEDQQTFVSYAPLTRANGTVCMARIVISPQRRQS